MKTRHTITVMGLALLVVAVTLVVTRADPATAVRSSAGTLPSPGATIADDHGASSPFAGAPVTFTDVTASAGIRLDATFTWGLAWGDYNNDGYADLFVSRHGAAPSLYRNNRDGTFTDVTRQAGVALRTDRHGCSWGDYNADTFLDLYCATGAENGKGSIPNQLFRNDGTGIFTDVAAELGVDDGPGRGRTANWLDYDADGHLDLYVANDRRDGFPSRLFRGAFAAFEDVSHEANVADGLYLARGGSSWADYDGDGAPDILVAAYGRLVLHQNQGNGTFLDKAASAGLVVAKARIGAWGDYDNDGDLDLFVGGGGPEVLYQNLGDDTFRDVTASSGLAQSAVQGAMWGDYDNDGDLDLFVVNRYNPSLAQNAPDALYLNNGDGTFSNVAGLAGVVGPTSGRGDSAAWADFNNDGFLDLFVTNGDGKFLQPGPAALYRNDGNGNHWLELRLHGTTNNTFGYGAKVWITSNGKGQFRQLTDDVVTRAQSDQIVHFGLGSATTVDEISIRWPNGQIQRLFDVAANQILSINQPSP
jgi:hypothetical protein